MTDANMSVVTPCRTVEEVNEAVDDINTVVQDSANQNISSFAPQPNISRKPPRHILALITVNGDQLAPLLSGDRMGEWWVLTASPN
ncbi:unnamed protein product [Nezara viridula]|uniref:Uncharacterized protein n=1 Tax=Nezara viridula TaxID=85310 RepID=A0A9P0HHL4_NEZVI|nr:unnamed protein product [Nezara viridula]